MDGKLSTIANSLGRLKVEVGIEGAMPVFLYYILWFVSNAGQNVRKRREVEIWTSSPCSSKPFN